MTMGATFNYRLFADELGETGILQVWEDMCEQSRYESGHSYSGCIGMLKGKPRWNDAMLATEDEAREVVADRHEKWEAPLAVSYNENGQKFWLIGGWCSS
jgi:hypothetical protein